MTSKPKSILSPRKKKDVSEVIIKLTASLSHLCSVLLNYHMKDFQDVVLIFSKGQANHIIVKDS